MGLSQVKAITLLELMVVIIIIGVLAALGLPRFGTMREGAFDKEARANLKLIQAAEKIYNMETGGYLACPDEDCINDDLKLALPEGAERNWIYYTNANGDAFAQRNGDDSRTWTLPIDGDDPS